MYLIKQKYTPEHNYCTIFQYIKQNGIEVGSNGLSNILILEHQTTENVLAIKNYFT